MPKNTALVPSKVRPVLDAIRRALDAVAPDPVVAIVSVTGTDVVEAVKVTVAGLKLQVL
jgi:hypothetical protein